MRKLLIHNELLDRAVFIALLLLAVLPLRATEYKLWYDKPATYFEEALVIGNGRLGATVYGGVEKDRISLNDITLWTGEPDRGDDHPDVADARARRAEMLRKAGYRKASAKNAVKWVRSLLAKEDYKGAEEAQKALQGHFSESYQPLGTLYIDYGEGDAERYRRELNISEAVASVQSGHRNVEYLASAPDSAIVIRITDSEGIFANISFESGQMYETTSDGNSLVIDGYTAYHAYPGYYDRGDKPLRAFDPDRGIHFRTVISVDEGEARDSVIVINGATSATITIVNETSFNGFDKDPVKQGKEYKNAALNRAKRLANKQFAQIREDAVADYKSLFDRLQLRISPDITCPVGEPSALPTDQRLLAYANGAEDLGLEELYFQFGRYLLISSSRTAGVPANLQGLWNESVDPPWSCNYTININLEENYWPSEVANLSDLHLVMLQWLKGLSANGADAAKSYYAVRKGWNAGHNSDIWAMATPVGLGVSDPCWADWTMGGAWLSTHIWEHYLFSRDKAFLKEYYPILKGAAQFCLKWLVSKDGELITSPGTSPENKYRTPDGFEGATSYGNAADLAFVRECLTDAVKASKALGRGCIFRHKAKRALRRLRSYQIAADGHLQEWYYDWADQDPQHRHQSHLAGLYPGHQITPSSTPELADAAAKVLEIKGDNTTGWSTGWRVNLYSRLGDAEGAYRIYRRLLQYVSPDGYDGPDKRRGGGTYPNLLDAHSPFQIDGNFGGCAGVLEMLVQSDENSITLLPACPKQWPEGSLTGVRTRTGATIAFTWQDGKVTDFRYLSVPASVDTTKITVRR